jgi:hypothetical protein
VGSVNDYILSLQLGAGSPLSAADQLALVKANYDAAKATYESAVTPENLQALQAASQNYLSVASSQMVDESGTLTPEYTDLVASIIADLEHAVSLAPDTEANMQAQLDSLTAMNDALAETNASLQSEIDSLTAINTSIDAQRKADLDTAEANRKHDHDLVDQATKDLTQAIEDARDAQILNINQQVAAQLTALATMEATAYGELMTQQLDLLNAVTGGLDAQSFLALRAQDTVDKLEEIRKLLEGFLGGQGHAAGVWEVPAVGAYKLHPGEMVVPAEPAAAMRAGAGAGSRRGATRTIRVPIYLDGKQITEVVVDRINRPGGPRVRGDRVGPTVNRS